MTLIEDDYVVQTFAADRSDEAFDKWILPGRPRSSNDLVSTGNPKWLTSPFESVDNRLDE